MRFESLIHANENLDNKSHAPIIVTRIAILCDMLKNRHLQLILSVSLVCVVGCGLIVIYIPPFAKDHDIPNDKIAILVTIMGACDLLS
jgi:O-antigen/teichoic acid export membrane protein